MGKLVTGMILVLCTLAQGDALGSSHFNVIPLRCALQGMDLNGVPWDKIYLSNGLEDYMFDPDDDGMANLELLVPIDGDNRLPQFYWFNDEFAVTRYTIQDTLRDGTCNGMVLIETPKAKADFRKGA